MSAAQRLEQTDTVNILSQTWDVHGQVTGERMRPVECFHRVGDWTVTRGDPGARFIFYITHAPSGKMATHRGHDSLDEAKRYADAYAVALAGVDPTTLSTREQADDVKKRVRELAERV